MKRVISFLVTFSLITLSTVPPGRAFASPPQRASNKTFRAQALSPRDFFMTHPPAEAAAVRFSHGLALLTLSAHAGFSATWDSSKAVTVSPFLTPHELHLLTIGLSAVSALGAVISWLLLRTRPPWKPTPLKQLALRLPLPLFFSIVTLLLWTPLGARLEHRWGLDQRRAPQIHSELAMRREEKDSAFVEALNHLTIWKSYGSSKASAASDPHLRDFIEHVRVQIETENGGVKGRVYYGSQPCRVILYKNSAQEKLRVETPRGWVEFTYVLRSGRGTLTYLGAGSPAALVFLWLSFVGLAGVVVSLKGEIFDYPEDSSPQAAIRALQEMKNRRIHLGSAARIANFVRRLSSAPEPLMPTVSVLLTWALGTFGQIGKDNYDSHVMPAVLDVLGKTGFKESLRGTFDAFLADVSLSVDETITALEEVSKIKNSEAYLPSVMEGLVGHVYEMTQTENDRIDRLLTLMINVMVQYDPQNTLAKQGWQSFIKAVDRLPNLALEAIDVYAELPGRDPVFLSLLAYELNGYSHFKKVLSPEDAVSVSNLILEFFPLTTPLPRLRLHKTGFFIVPSLIKNDFAVKTEDAIYFLRETVKKSLVAVVTRRGYAELHPVSEIVKDLESEAPTFELFRRDWEYILWRHDPSGETFADPEHRAA